MSQILTSLHGRKVGLNSKGELVVANRVIKGQTLAGSPERVQAAPGVLDTTGTLTVALTRGGIVTSAAAAVTATLDTGAVIDAALVGDNKLVVGDAWEWSVIKTGANAFTVTAAASGHTIVGSGVVATATSGHFLTRKTAAETFVTYRLS